ncbi:hypothetical protein LDO31_00270 [Luteimonas sp. XNQY3]|nr:hypothetical protein [Luteimonas sp. XNQY3]MCD9004685.1 hypothetical protein [Luteimonas sp. XNQY3]
MTRFPRTLAAPLALACALGLGLTACSNDDPAASTPASSNASVLTLDDGPDVCLRKLAETFGADVEIAELSSQFSAGDDISGLITGVPQGQLVTCSAKYRSPDDPRKLLSAQLDTNTGEFGEPRPVNITVMGGDASQFDLDQHVVALSQIDAAAIAGLMEARKPQLDSHYSAYAWKAVLVEGPRVTSPAHTLRLGLQGRLAANDVVDSRFLTVSIPGGEVVEDIIPD